MNVIIAAMSEELQSLIDDLKASEIIKYDYMKLYQHGIWLIAVTQIGMVNAAMALTTLINDYAIKRVYNLGTAGALKPDLKVLDVFYVKHALYAYADATKFGYAFGQIPREPICYDSDEKLLNDLHLKTIKMQPAVLGTSDVFICSKEQVEYVKRNFNDEIDLADMEGTSFFQVAHKNNIPILSIKVVSDNYWNLCHSTEQFDINLAKAATIIKEIALSLIGRV